MSTYSENPGDLRTDAIPEAPRDPQGPKPSNNNSPAGENADDGKNKPCGATGFSSYPNGSIFITNCNGVHLGTVINNMRVEKSQKMPDYHVPPPPELVEKMFKKEDLVTVKDLRYLKRTNLISVSGFPDTSRELGYTEAQFEHFAFDPNNYQKPGEIIYQCLLDWINNCREMNGYDPTVGRLANVLWNTGSQDAVLKWAKKVLKY